jgi:hypothetical protein
MHLADMEKHATRHRERACPIRTGRTLADRERPLRRKTGVAIMAAAQRRFAEMA